MWGPCCQSHSGNFYSNSPSTPCAQYPHLCACLILFHAEFSHVISFGQWDISKRNKQRRDKGLPTADVLLGRWEEAWVKFQAAGKGQAGQLRRWAQPPASWWGVAARVSPRKRSATAQPDTALWETVNPCCFNPLDTGVVCHTAAGNWQTVKSHGKQQATSQDTWTLFRTLCPASVSSWVERGS